jgi:DNA-binding transcriptional ArsR family regulator
VDKQEALQYHQALGDSLRIEIVRQLQEEWRSGAMLSRKLGVTAATMSHHLSKLKMTGGLQEDDRRGRNDGSLLPRRRFAYPMAGEAGGAVCGNDRDL